MKIYACIPTYNEASNIQSITRVIDHGLQLLLDRYPGWAACIVNADSASSDDTVDKFKATATRIPKTVIQQTQKGKGLNLLKFIELAYIDGADYCLTIDADVASAGPDWVRDLLPPLLRDEADFVAPLYERNRFEGSTTVHFAYPTILGFTGQVIRQPIGGDFAFSRRFVSLVSHERKPASAYAYGIDIFLTYLAVASGLRVAQVPLGKKIHTPSFSKLEGMFPQVAEAAAYMVREYQPTGMGHSVTPSVGITAQGTKTSDEALNALYERTRRQLANSPTWLPHRIAAVTEVAARTNDQMYLSSTDWIDTLVAWYREALTRDASNVTGPGKELLPYFVLRAMGFWNEVGYMSPALVEKLIEEQASEFQLRVTALRSR